MSPRKWQVSERICLQVLLFDSLDYPEPIGHGPKAEEGSRGRSLPCQNGPSRQRSRSTISELLRSDGQLYV